MGLSYDIHLKESVHVGLQLLSGECRFCDRYTNADNYREEAACLETCRMNDNRLIKTTITVFGMMNGMEWNVEEIKISARMAG